MGVKKKRVVCPECSKEVRRLDKHVCRGKLRECPHCQRQLVGHSAPNHAARCPKNPENFEEYRSVLNDGFDCIISSTSYYEMSTGPNFALLGRTALVGVFGGTWSEVARFFDLEYDPAKSPGRPRKDGLPGLAGMDQAVTSMFQASTEALAYWEEFLDFPVCKTYTNKRGETVRVLGSSGLAWRNQYRMPQQQQGAGND